MARSKDSPSATTDKLSAIVYRYIITQLRKFLIQPYQLRYIQRRKLIHRLQFQTFHHRFQRPMLNHLPMLRILDMLQLQVSSKMQRPIIVSNNLVDIMLLIITRLPQDMPYRNTFQNSPANRRNGPASSATTREPLETAAFPMKKTSSVFQTA